MRFDGSDKSQEIGEDINLVIDAKIPGLTRYFDDEKRKVITTRLKSMENRTYLWLYLIMDIIENSRSEYQKVSSLELLLSELPSSVSDAYEKILGRSRDKVKARIILQLIVAATRPLTLMEANVALTIATTKGCTTEKALDLWPLENFKETIQNMCGLFITVYSEKLFLIHQTAREYLIDTPEANRKWKGCSNLAMANGTISKICLEYLNFEDIGDYHDDNEDDEDDENDENDENDKNDKNDEDDQNDEDGKDADNDDDKEVDTGAANTKVSTLGQNKVFYLLDYAAKNWATHYASHPGDVPKI